MGQRAYFIDLDDMKAYYDHWAAYDLQISAKQGRSDLIKEVIKEWNRKEGKNINSVEEAKKYMDDWEIEAGIIKSRNRYYVWLSTSPWLIEDTPVYAIANMDDPNALQAAAEIITRAKTRIQIKEHVPQQKKPVLEEIDKAICRAAEAEAYEKFHSLQRLMVRTPYTTVHPLDIIAGKVIIL